MDASHSKKVRMRPQGLLELVLKRGLRGSLLLWFLALSLVPLALVSVFSYLKAYASLYEGASRSMRSDRQTKAQYIRSRMSRIMTDLEGQAEMAHNVDFLTDLRRSFVESGKTLGDFVWSYDWELIIDRLSGDLRTFHRTYDYRDVFLIDSEGNVLFSARDEHEMRINLFSGKYADSRFGRACRKALDTGRPAFSDFELHPYSADGIAAFVVSILVDDAGEKIGLIAFEVPISLINEIMQAHTGSAGTEETYLVGPDKRMRSDSYLDPTGRSVSASFASDVSEGGVDTQASRDALAGNSGVKIITGYRGIEVLSAYGPIDILGLNWALLAEIDTAEALGPARSLLLIMLVLTGVVAVVVFLAASVVARKLAAPLVSMSAATSRIAAGELNVRVPTGDRRDEIGVLADSFAQVVESTRQMAGVADRIAEGDLTVEVQARSDGDVLGKALENMSRNLREQIGEILKGTNVMASSTSQILASTTQLASSSIETATSMSQTTTTLEEVKQTAAVSAQKSKEVSEGAQRIVQTAEGGKESAREVVARMTHIREQMSSIADSIGRFGEQSLAIGEIISTVDDLAGQSNLLAVNAAIEATRAGEEGKGFGVVADEIKSLSEQSRQATTQVRTILNDIQKATGRAVEAAEQGGDAVEAGMEQSIRAGEAIQALTDVVTDAANSAMQIAASSQQQLVGVDQVAGAMVSIKEASTQNVASTQQVETVALSLDEVGKRLKELVGKYLV